MCRNYDKRHIHFPGNILQRIKEDTKTIGYNVSINAWVVQACKDKLDNSNHRVKRIIKKLEDWEAGFPKRRFRDILEEIKDGSI